MEMHQIKYLALASILLGIVCKKEFNNFYIYENRKMNLNSISKDYYLSSDDVKRAREKLDSSLVLKHENDEVKKCINLFLNSYSKEELLILRNNIQTLKVKNDNLEDYCLDGAYELDNNTIISNNDAFNHEMHHVASTLGIVNNIMISGFMQDKEIDGKNYGIGMGINEGYTEYLSIKQIGNDNMYYNKIVCLIPLIELFFDNEIDLRKLYFNADLEALINRFSLVCSRSESVELIKDIDKLVFYDCFRSWFDKTDVIELSIRLRLLDYYEKLSGNNNLKDLFLPENMAYELKKAKKLVI